PGPAPEGMDSTGDPVMNLPWTHAGLPTLSLPAGVFPNGLPAGLQIAAPFGRDEHLLRFGIDMERILNTLPTKV
ncbi:MAG: amidase, partial [Treponema sp.]|nr:amidase [Treponema sp.]